MRYLSVCSGIEAASVAWHPLGWTPVAFSEIEPFPAAVLAHRFPNVPNYGDMTKHKEWPLGPGSIDLLVGGTPCQSFSVAGLRKGLSDPRGGLMLTYLEIAQRLRPRWVVWENVPGVLSSGGGRDFGSFLGALGHLGYQYAYRVLDAQWVRTHGHPRAVPQRRRRVFVVGCLGDGTAAAEVLFERESVCRDSAPRRAAREEAPADAGAGTSDGCYWNGEQVAAALTRKGCDDRMPDKERLFAVLQPVAVEVADALVARNNQTTGFQTEVCAQPVAYRWQNDRDGLVSDGTVSALRASAGESGFHEMNHPVVAQPAHAVAFDWQKGNDVNNPRPSTMNVAVEHSQTIGTTRTPAVAFTVDMQACKGNANVGDGSVSPTLCKPSGNDVHAVAFQQNQVGEVRTGAVAGTVNTNSNPSGRNTPMVAIGTDCYNGAVTGDVAATMGTPESSVNASGPTVMQAVAFQGGSQQDQIMTPDSVVPTLAHSSNSHGGHHQPKVMTAMTVRRLTPRECERLQGFPDDWTLIPWRGKPAADCPDGPRYKALGNSMACNCMAWIGERIAAVEARHAG